MRSLVVGNALLWIFLAAVPAIGQAQQTYSDVTEVEESGDLVGTELTLHFAGESVTGALRYYEGTEPDPITVAGRLVGNALTLRGSYAEGKVEIKGRLENGRITGTLLFHLPGQTNDVELNLPRVERRRMQKTTYRPTPFSTTTNGAQ